MVRVIIFTVITLALVVFIHMSVSSKYNKKLTILFKVLFAVSVIFLLDSIVRFGTGQGIWDHLIQIIGRYQDYMNQKLVKRR